VRTVAESQTVVGSGDTGTMSRGARIGLSMVAALIVLLGAALRLVALDHLPPGLHFDEAVYGLLAEDIRGGARPVFFGSYTGREPLYMYAMAALFAMLGPSTWAIRLTSALAGTVTVALVFALGRALFGPRAAVGAALAVALSFWHLVVSRNGYPNVLIPPLAAASAWWLWRGWNGGRRRDWAVGGALAGLVLYTYLAARFWPVFLVALMGWAAVVEPGRMRRRVGGIALAVLAMLLVFAPLGAHFARHPADFWERASQVLASQELDGAALWAAYAKNARETAAGFLGRGDPRWHYNLPGRPMVAGMWGLLFVAGVATCIVRVRQVRFALVPLWIAVMALPGILTLELQPAGQRMFGIVPAVALACGLGASTLADGAAAVAARLRSGSAVSYGRRRSALAPRGAALAAVLALGALLPGDLGLAGAVPAYRDWSGRLETAHIFNADYAAMARMALGDVEAGRTVVMLSEHYRHPTVAFVAPELAESAVWADPRVAVPIPARGTDEIAYYAPLSYLPEDAPALAWLAGNALEATRWSVDTGTGVARPSAVAPPARGQTALEASTSEGDEPRPIVTDFLRFVLRADAGAWLDVEPQRGMDRTDDAPALRRLVLGDIVAVRPPTATEGDVRVFERNRPAVVPVHWQVMAPPPADAGLRLVLRMTDGEGRGMAQADDEGYLAVEWRPGDRVVQWFALPIERTMPPGEYSLELRLVDSSGRALPATLIEGAESGQEGRVAHLDPVGALQALRSTPAGAPIGGLRLLPEGRIRATEDELKGALLRWPQEGDPHAGLALLSAGPLPAEPVPPGACFDLVLAWARTGASEAAPIADPDTFELSLAPGRTRRVGALEPSWTATGPGALVQSLAVAPSHPVADWRERERLTGRYRVCAPADPLAKEYRVMLRRVTTRDSPAVDDWLALGTVAVADVARVSSLPPGVTARPEATFNELWEPCSTCAIAQRATPRAILRGVHVAWPGAPGGQDGALVVTLWWQALSRFPDVHAERVIQAFVHLEGPGGELLAQDDGPLGGSARPPAGWQLDEIVPVRHELPLPNGIAAEGLTLGIGLYDPVTGERYQLVDSEQTPGDDKLRLPIVDPSRVNDR